MFANHLMRVLVPMVALMRVRVGMRMRVAVRERRVGSMRVLRMFVLVRSVGPMRMRVARRAFIQRLYIHFGSGNSATAHLAHLEARTHIQRGSRLLKQAERNACIHKGAKQHIAADAGKALQVSNAHRSRILNDWLGTAPREDLRGKNGVH
jgi:hypothetical protein